MTNVVNFGGATKLDLPAERVLSKAIEADMSFAVVVGWDKNGEFYFGSTKADGGEVLWLLEVAKKKLLEMGGA